MEPVAEIVGKRIPLFESSLGTLGEYLPLLLLLPLLSRFSCFGLCVTPWTAVCQASLSMGFSTRGLEWVAMPSSRGSS